MKHGIRFFGKKLNRTASHREALMRNLLTQLVNYERIETTIAKAKFMQRQADLLIGWAKRNTPEDRQKMRKNTFVPDITLPKLHFLAHRYQNLSGGFTRVLRNGFRVQGSDRAEMAIVELIANPRDTVHAMAVAHLPQVKNNLEATREQLYKVEKITIQNPFTKEEEYVVRYSNRHDLRGNEKKKLSKIERHLDKLSIKMERSMRMWDEARRLDSEGEEKNLGTAFRAAIRQDEQELEDVTKQPESPSMDAGRVKEGVAASDKPEVGKVTSLMSKLGFGNKK